MRSEYITPSSSCEVNSICSFLKSRVGDGNEISAKHVTYVTVIFQNGSLLLLRSVLSYVYSYKYRYIYIYVNYEYCVIMIGYF